MAVAALVLDGSIFSPLTLIQTLLCTLLTLHAPLPDSFFFKNELGYSVSLSVNSLDQAQSQMGLFLDKHSAGKEQLLHPHHACGAMSSVTLSHCIPSFHQNFNCLQLDHSQPTPSPGTLLLKSLSCHFVFYEEKKKDCKPLKVGLNFHHK